MGQQPPVVADDALAIARRTSLGDDAQPEPARGIAQLMSVVVRARETQVVDALVEQLEQDRAPRRPWLVDQGPALVLEHVDDHVDERAAAVVE